LRADTASGGRLVLSVSAAHFVSHYYILLLPPLFEFVRADYGVSYTELGLALLAHNLVSALLQTPTGFLVDRFGARALLIGALILGAIAYGVAGIVHSFWVLVAMFAVAGLANTVYHPADYALLSHHVPPARIAKAFSVHTFAGMLGSAAAPGTLLLMQSLWGWRGAFVGTAALGLVVAGWLLLQKEEPSTNAAAPPTTAPVGWALLLSPVILINLLFFLLLALVNAGLQNYSVVALTALYGTSAATANAALTGFLGLTAAGVLLGGYIAARTTRHGLVTALTLVATAAVVALIAGVALRDLLLIAAMSAAGLFIGIGMPARDMIVRAVTPPGAFGKVFGFVSTGFNIGGMISPVIFGLAMDHGRPQWVFWLAGLLSLLAIFTVVGTRGGPPERTCQTTKIAPSEARR
jgi:MFS family permease